MPAVVRKDTLGSELADIKRRLRALEHHNPLNNASVEGLLKSADFDGDLAKGNPGTKGWALGGGGLGMAIAKLFLRGNIIGNDALANPVIPDQGYNFGSGWQVAGSSSSPTTVATYTNTVPAGCTRMLSLAIGEAYAVNRTANLDYLYSRIYVNAYYGDAIPSPASGSGGSTQVSAVKQGLLTGLTPGDTITTSLVVWANSGAAWGDTASSVSTLNGILLWMR